MSFIILGMFLGFLLYMGIVPYLIPGKVFLQSLFFMAALIGFGGLFGLIVDTLIEISIK